MDLSVHRLRVRDGLGGGAGAGRPARKQGWAGRGQSKRVEEWGEGGGGEAERMALF